MAKKKFSIKGLINDVFKFKKPDVSQKVEQKTVSTRGKAGKTGGFKAAFDNVLSGVTGFFLGRFSKKNGASDVVDEVSEAVSEAVASHTTEDATPLPDTPLPLPEDFADIPEEAGAEDISEANRELLAEQAAIIIENAKQTIIQMRDTYNVGRKKQWVGKSKELMDLIDEYAKFDDGIPLAKALEDARAKGIITDKYMYYETNRDEIEEMQERNMYEIENIVMEAVSEVETIEAVGGSLGANYL